MNGEAVPAVGPVRPSDAVRQELEAYLETDSTSFVDVWRRTRDGEPPEQIGVARGTRSPTFVWRDARMAKARQAADHERSAAWTGGAEWFLPSLPSLDVIAETLSLPVTVVNDPEVAD
jgi:hypothetical protein